MAARERKSAPERWDTSGMDMSRSIGATRDESRVARQARGGADDLDGHGTHQLDFAGIRSRAHHQRAHRAQYELGVAGAEEIHGTQRAIHIVEEAFALRRRSGGRILA